MTVNHRKKNKFSNKQFYKYSILDNCNTIYILQKQIILYLNPIKDLFFILKNQLINDLYSFEL